MAASLAFRHFDGESEEWELYKEQLEQYFVSNGVKEEVKKALLINQLSAKTYKLLRDLCTPDQPKDKSYADLCNLLSTHFTPPVIIHKDRRVFARAKRGENGSETVNEWIVRLKNLAASCKFGVHLQHNLVNKFIDGLDGKAYDRICEENENLTLERAQEIALKYEIESASQISHQYYVKGKSDVYSNWKKKADSSQPPQRKRESMKCFACNESGHFWRVCRFREYVCKKCNKKGHIRAACGIQRANYVAEGLDGEKAGLGEESQSVVQENYLSESKAIEIYSIDGVKEIERPIKLEVFIGGEKYAMELDTGAAISVVSWDFFVKYLSHCELRKTMVKLVGYDGRALLVKGAISPSVKFENKEKSVVFVVVEKGGPPLVGRNFVRAFGIQFSVIKNIQQCNDMDLSKLIEKYSELFSNKLGCYKYREVKIEVDEKATPIFKNPRPVPFKFRDLMAQELDNMENLGIISKCNTSLWGTPLVPVLKSDGSLRLCGDYKVTVNREVKDVKHPLPTVDEILTKLNGAQYFSKLDLSKCYNQFMLDVSSRDLCAISTIQGVYRMNRLPFGIRPASGIVQKELEKLLSGIEGVQNFLDDIVVTGSTKREHLTRLGLVFQALLCAGLKLNKEKCEFFKSGITFLGYTIDKNGVRKTDDRIRAIRDAREPQNVTEVRAFAGLVNYYARFVRDVASIMAPMYVLLRKGETFVWTNECSVAFKRIKDEICKDVSLAHFDPSLEIILICDASNEGVSAVLSQKSKTGIERPVAYASRILHSSEKNYSVIDKEALAIMYGVNKFFLYLVGNRFLIRTDHKPLLRLLHPQKGVPTIAASRMQRWAHFLSGFNYGIEHVKSEQNIADFASRFPTESWKLWKEEDSYLNFINQETVDPLTVQTLITESKNDCEIHIVTKVLRGEASLSELKDSPYKTVFDELSLENGVVMRGHRVVVPKALRSLVLAQIHQSHLGIVKCKSVARSSVWWPGIDVQLEDYVRNCSVCLFNTQSPPKAKLIPWSSPRKVWSRVHVDFAGPVKGMSFLLIVDALSKWVEVFPTKNCTSAFVLEKLTECIARFGLFDELVSDNGTQFLASDIQKFLKANGITHKLTSPGHPSTNGAAENMVKTFKNSLIKCLQEGKKCVSSIVTNFLIGYRKANHCTTEVSPAQMMLGRDIRTTLDLLKPSILTEDNQVAVSVKERIAQKQQSQMRNYRGTRVETFEIGERVISRDYSNPNKVSWTPAIVTSISGPRNYYVRLEHSGRIIKRHLDQLKKDTRLLGSGELVVSPKEPKPGSSSIATASMPVKRSFNSGLVVDNVSASPSGSVVNNEESVVDTVPEIDRTKEVPLNTNGSVEREVEELSSAENEGYFTPNEEDSSEQEEGFSSEDDAEAGLVVSGFARGFWRLRDKQGRIFKG
ncbi:uncharacterized protein K02A2.6-like [Uranotaenia lowii]|uniref:uncharacterized protein K02A2.6-like n=1 Tax=Uranotaenia lowii TaxID=190385 RepID=UPI00247A707B|nr:uncharacterized protein K02A2.6-like [Uranotaenia lowii]